MRIAILTAILFFAAAPAVFAEQKCFQNDALKGKQIVVFTQTGAKISGAFEYENGESELARRYEFTGTRAGNSLRVKFADGKMPDVAPSEMTRADWRIETTGSGAEILRIEFYGKNYQTNRYENYFADFVPCEPDYETLAKAAVRVRFAKGKTSASVKFSFAEQSEKKSFWLNARKNQTISIRSIGCAISFYYPDKTRYAEGAGVDVLTLEKIPQAGDYLFIVSPAGAAGECLTEIAITGK